MRGLQHAIRGLGALRSFGFATWGVSELRAGCQALLQSGFSSSAASSPIPAVWDTAPKRSLAAQQLALQRQPAASGWTAFVMDPLSQLAVQPLTLVGIAPFLEPQQGDSSAEPVVWQAESVQRKRKSKMNKHKHKKRLKRDRRKSR